jgi:hypothetical protein
LIVWLTTMQKQTEKKYVFPAEVRAILAQVRKNQRERAKKMKQPT